MALTTTSTPALPGVHVRGADLGALVCAASAGTHAALVAPHVHESTGLAVAFALAAGALVVAALAEASTPAPLVQGAVAALLLALAVAYLLSRTVGIPVLLPHPEPFDPIGGSLSLLEAAAAVAVGPPNPRRHR